MKIVFLQHLWYEWQAPMILSAIAKQKGHTAELYIEPNPITAALRVVERGADLVAFASVVTGNMDYVYACAKQIKEIAEILHIKETTIQTRLMRARAKIKSKVKGDLLDE